MRKFAFLAAVAAALAFVAPSPAQAQIVIGTGYSPYYGGYSKPWAAQVEAGNALIVRNGVTGALLDEHRSFPLGTHDDMVDACSGAFAEVARPPVSFAVASMG